MIWLYGVAELAATIGGRGLAGEPLTQWRGDGLTAVAGELPEAPALSAPHLRGHDEVVRRIASAAPAFLPARFGQTFVDAAALARAVAERAEALREALALVRGGSQMTLRWFGEASTASREAPAVTAPGWGPGARYLESRRIAIAARQSLPGTEDDRASLAPWVRCERTRQGGAAGLVGTAYHLVLDNDLPAYRQALDAVLEAPRAYRLQASGPWPNYAFAPELTP